MYLIVECHEFDSPVVFREPVSSVNKVYLFTCNLTFVQQYAGYMSSANALNNSMVLVLDAELNKDNPVEAKYLKLMRPDPEGKLLPFDKYLKPNNVETKQITVRVYGCMMLKLILSFSKY